MKASTSLLVLFLGLILLSLQADATKSRMNLRSRTENEPVYRRPFVTCGNDADCANTTGVDGTQEGKLFHVCRDRLSPTGAFQGRFCAK